MDHTSRKGEILNVSGLAIEGLEDVVQIGTGGSSRVYRARQTALDRVVAVKVINASQDPSVARRFDRERKAMGRLSSHEGIVPVYSTGVTATGEPFLVMPYYPDGSLQDQIDAGPVPWQIAVRYVDVAAETISVAHGAGIVHLDIKPANILLTPSGAPRIADFGIAKLTSSTHTARTTGTAFTPAYSAPETFLDGKATPAADVYGLGATLWALLVGHPPFLAPGDDSNLMAVIGRVVNNPTGQINHLAPQQICEVVYKAMEKRPQDRFASASDFSAALKQALHSSQNAAVATSAAAAPAPAPAFTGASTQVFAASGPVVSSARTMAPGPGTVQPHDEPAPIYETAPPPGRSLLQNEAEVAPHAVAYREPVQRAPMVDFDRFRFGPILVALIALLGMGMLVAWALNRPASDDVAASETATPAAPSITTTTEGIAPVEPSVNTLVGSGFGNESGTADQESTSTTATTAAVPQTTSTTEATEETTTSSDTTETTLEETTTTEEETTTTTDGTSTTSTSQPDGDLQAPESVEAQMDAMSVQLTWSAPTAGPTPESYVVYRDGEPVATVASSPYVDQDVPVGERSYRIGSVSQGPDAITVLSSAVRIVVVEPPVEDFAITVTVLRVTDSAITLEITGNQCVAAYRVGYMVTPEAGVPGVPLGPVVEDGLPCPGGQPIRIARLDPATSYDISVTALNEQEDVATYDLPAAVVTEP